ncbi:MAG TPA: 2-dehydropantoate 2-reductase, partial [Candidatus Limnocylindrales bacterium]
GSLGGYFGGRLAMAGEEVHFLGRGPTLAALKASGLRVESVLGDFAVPPGQTHATDDPASIGPVQIVLFTVKSFDTESAAATLPPLLGRETAVISLQNGIHNEDVIASTIGPQHTAGGVAFIFAGVVEPGFVRHTGGPARITFGELDGSRTPRLEAFLAACLHAGINAELSDDIRAALWTKFTFICAQAGLTAATRQPIGVIRETPLTWDLFCRVVSEVVSVARAAGVRLPDDIVERQLDVVRGLQPTAYSSLYDDMVAGRRMELEGLLGELVRRADREGIPTPVASVLYGVLLPTAAQVR